MDNSMEKSDSLIRNSFNSRSFIALMMQTWTQCYCSLYQSLVLFSCAHWPFSQLAKLENLHHNGGANQNGQTVTKGGRRR